MAGSLAEPLELGHDLDRERQEHLVEQRVLVGEVPVDRALGDAGGLGDLPRGRARETVPKEDLQSRVDQRLARVGLAWWLSTHRPSSAPAAVSRRDVAAGHDD